MKTLTLQQRKSSNCPRCNSNDVSVVDVDFVRRKVKSCNECYYPGDTKKDYLILLSKGQLVN